MASLASANTAFTLDLYRTLESTNAGGNIFFSPLSISSALAMVFLGARGNTADQIQKVLHFQKGSDVHSGFQTLNAEINRWALSQSGFTNLIRTLVGKRPKPAVLMKLANRLYGEKTCKFLPEFLKSTGKFYSADLVPLDFIGATEKSRTQINQWVEGQTEGKLKDLLKPGAVSGMTRLALVNAICFKGSWLHRFDEKMTEEMPFKINQNESKRVQMMFQKEKFPFNYVPEYNLQVLELPYRGEELSMLILLPEESPDGAALKKLERELTLEKINSWTDRNSMSTHAEVRVHLPRFKLEEDYELNSPLGRLGMSDVFEEARADLSGMNGGGGLFLSAMVHKAFVEVNEEGTEAAAATAGIVRFCMLREENFTADHPFLFFIRHNPSRSIIFFGRFSSP